MSNLIEARARLVGEMRSLLDSLDADAGISAEDNTKLERMEGDIDRLSRAIDAEARVAKFDAPAAVPAAILNPSAPEVRNTDADQISRLLSGEIRSAEFRSVLSKLSASAGANTVPTSMYDQLVEHMIENSTVMQAKATVLNTGSGESIQIPKTSSYSTAALITETAAAGASVPAFGQTTLDAFKYGFLAQLSSELLSDSNVDIVGFLAKQGGQALGNGIGAALVAGDGSSKPNGIFTAATSGKTAAGTATVTSDELIDLYHSIVTGYRANASWIMKDSSLAIVRKLKDTTGQYLWQPGMQAGAPDTLFGRPVYTDPNAPAMTTGLKSVLFGDLSGYYVRLAGGVRIERSDDFAFDTDMVTFRFLLRVDGDLVDTNAVRVLTQA